MLQDIIDEYNLETNYNYVRDKYINWLERGHKWDCVSNPKHAKCNFKCRLNRLHNEGEHDTRTYKEFLSFIEKCKNMDQKQAERTARKLQEDWENKLKEALKQIEAQKLEIEQLKEMNIQLEKEKGDLITKYDEGYEKLEEENEQLKEERHKVIQDAYQCHYDTWKAEQENIVITELKEENEQLKESDKHLNKCIDYLRDQYLEIKGDNV